MNIDVPAGVGAPPLDTQPNKVMKISQKHAENLHTNMHQNMNMNAYTIIILTLCVVAIVINNWGEPELTPHLWDCIAEVC